MKQSIGRILALALSLSFSGAVAQVLTPAQKDALKKLEVNQYSKAGNALRDAFAAKADGNNAFCLGKFYLEIDKPDSALSIFEAGAKSDPTNGLAPAGIGSYYMYKGDKAKAKEQFIKALQLSKGKSVEVLYRIGEAYTIYEANEPVEAIKILEAASKMDPKNAAIYLMIGDAYLLKNDGSTASVYYEQKAKFYEPKNPAAYYKLGVLMERARNYTEAVNLYKQGLSLDPGYSLFYKELGEVYYLAKRFTEAIANYREYIRQTDNNVKSLYMYSGFLIENKQYKYAYDTLKMVAPFVEQPQKYRALAYCQFELKECKDGLANIEKFFSLMKDTTKYRVDDYDYYGKLLICAGGDSVKAGAMLMKAAALDTNRRLATNRYLGATFLNSKNYNAAIPYLNWVLNRKECNNKDIYDLGRCYFYAKDYANADTTFGYLNQKFPQFTVGYYWKAQSIAKFKDPNTEKYLAKPYYEQFIAGNPDAKVYKPYLMVSYKYLANYYSLYAKDTEKAKEMLNKALEIDPSDKYAKEGLDALNRPAAPVKPAKPAAPAKGKAPVKTGK